MSQSTDFSRRPMKRRSLSRKVSRDCVVNMAEARKQIEEALQLHRSSTSSSSTMAMSVSEHGGCYGCVFEKPMFFGSRHFCYSILESMPLPQPIWSTTAPSVLASPALPMEELEGFEWGDGQASYAWWLGFLRGLDVNSSPQCLNAGNATMLGTSSMELTQCQEGLEGGEAVFVEGSDQSSCTDEWLIIPISEDGGLIDGNCLGNDFASN